MQEERRQVAILLNGPPRAGKDTAVLPLLQNWSDLIDVFKFTQPVKELTHERFGLSVPFDHYEDLKDTRLAEFGGLTPREAYIETSTREKLLHGPDAVARLFVDAVSQSRMPVIVNPDCGDDMEASCVAELFGLENVLVIRVHKEGRDFTQDCRTWVADPAFNIVDVYNRDGEVEAFQSSVAEIVEHFLSQRLFLASPVLAA